MMTVAVNVQCCKLANLVICYASTIVLLLPQIAISNLCPGTRTCI